MTMLHDKVVLITGAGSGVGRTAALACAREGAHVAAVDLDVENSEVEVFRCIPWDKYDVQVWTVEVNKSPEHQIEIDHTRLMVTKTSDSRSRVRALHVLWVEEILAFAIRLAEPGGDD